MPEKRTGCKAYQCSDQMCCSECGLVWDMNDDDPPPCPRLKPKLDIKVNTKPAVRGLKKASDAVAKMRRLLQQG